MDKLQPFFLYLFQFKTIPTEMVEFLRASIRIHHYPKNHELVKIGQYHTGLFYILSGSARVCTISDDEEIVEKTFWFWHPNEIIIPFDIMDRDHPTTTKVVLNESSTLLSLPLVHLNELHRLFTEYTPLASSILQQVIVNLSNHIQNLSQLSAEDRYNHLLATHPYLLNIIHLKYIASFLGMSLNTLNHIRAIR